MRPVFEDDPVNPEQPLWRYFKLERIIESLTTRTLYFPSARQFEDPFEGATAIVRHDHPQDASLGPFEHFGWAFEELRRLTKISSWHRAGYECAAMWQLYASKGKGVAIRTTAERIREGLLPFRLRPHYGEEEPYWGNVRYVDLLATRLQPASMMRRFFHKHQAFEWEREFRVAISVRMAEEFCVPVPEMGINVSFDPSVLVESIYLGHSLGERQRANLEDACDSAGLSGVLRRSTLLGRPIYV